MVIVKLIRVDMEEVDMESQAMVTGRLEEAAAEVPYNWLSAQMPL